MTGIGILGHKGRMGQAIDAALVEAGVDCAGGCDKGDDPGSLANTADVLIDFTAPDALQAHLAAAVTAGIPIVIGTTGLEPQHHRAIDEAARSIAVLQTGNTSLGVTLLARLVREAAARLGPDWDIEIIEMHHRRKVDAPSGTALLLGEAAAAGRGAPLAQLRTPAREGQTGMRQEGSIGFAALRGGTVAGEHLVIFAGDEERLTLGHIAENRAIFARGAIRAALWLMGQSAGRYTMDDIFA